MALTLVDLGIRYVGQTRKLGPAWMTSLLDFGPACTRGAPEFLWGFSCASFFSLVPSKFPSIDSAFTGLLLSPDPTRVLPSCTGFLPSFTGSYWVSPSFIGFYWLLLGFIGFYLVLSGFIGFYWVLLGFVGVEWVLLGSERFYWVLLGFT